ncbi:DUF2975 domain-containing protein [Wukongibacter baidiensis]
MKIIGKEGISGIIEWVINLILIGGIGIWISLPWSLPWLIMKIKPSHVNDKKFFWFIILFLYITGILANWIVYETRNFFHSINQNTPFIYENVKSLRNIGYSSFVISVFFAIKIAYYPTILTIVMTMTFIIIGFFGIVVAEVFRQAVDVKLENDLTI